MTRSPQKKTRGSAPRGDTKTGRAKAKAAAPAKAPRAASRKEARKEDVAAGGWATALMFDVREPKLAVSLRLDADVLRFFRGFGSGYQTRINEVLKAFMHARQRAGLPPGAEGGSGAKAPAKKAASRRK